MQNFITILFCLISTCLVAQVEQLTPSTNNNNIIGGSLNISIRTNSHQPLVLIPNSLPSPFLSTTNVIETKYRAYSISPYYGRIINQNLMLGIIGQYAHSNDEVIGYRTSNIITLPTEPFNIVENTLSMTENDGLDFWLFARYTFKPEHKLRFIVEPMLGYRSNKRKSYYNSTDVNDPTSEDRTDSVDERKLFDVRIIPGISYALGRRWNILARLGAISYATGTEDRKELFITNLTDQRLDRRSSLNVSEFNANFRLSSFSFGLEFRF